MAVAPDVTFQQLREVAPRSERLLAMDPVSGWGTIRDLLVAPLLGGGSTVVVVGADEDTADRIRTQEHVELG